MADKNDVDLARVIESNRTIRTVAVCFVIVAGLAIIGVAMVALAKPAWVLLLMGIFGPSGLLVVLFKLHLRYVRKTHKRIVFLETIFDNRRSSSLTEGEANPEEGGKN